ncbi:non-ribosomal peptide synthetase [Enterovirga rhinocerotis]|uniref:L-cysteine--[L-cysteinyl-carrier protein] ligase n=1 Tax=Enterovirga rhinocerotis TaxID=1339210 RepID=A0A4R7C9P1_9HYPH|nr:non-ribosomal peptide synthetase [Enterovirga rhinocerotis]TDR95023.1 pyochelin synthetase [Enterovirga rhinocerotis]
MNATARPSVLRPDPERRHEPFPLTDIQHAYWIGQDSVLELGNVSCHAYFEWRLPELDIGRLETAWNLIVARHGMLRAVIRPDGMQCILPDVPRYAIPVEDLSGLPPDAVEARLGALREAMQHRAPDAANWPLFDLRVTQRSGDVVLHLDLDLLTVDVQSFHIILGELERLYARPELRQPPLALTFRDYVLGRGETGGAQHAADRDWWLARLPNLPQAPQLPLLGTPQSAARPDFVRRHGRVAPERWQRFERFATARNVTASGALLAAYAEVLAQWSRQADFCLNLTHFHRERLHPEVDSMVGDFTSVVLVPRRAPDIGSAFADRARKLQRETWTCLSHRAFSGIEVMRELGRLGGGGSRGTAMPVVFTSLLGLDIDALADHGDGVALLGEPDIVYTATPQVWLDHQAMVRHGALVFNWITVDALFPDGMAAAMFEAYTALLDRLCDDEATWDAPLAALLPAPQAESRSAANATECSIPPRRLESAFLERAEARPDAVALVWPDGEWSYAELAAAAATVAGQLVEAGVVSGDRVAVSLPRGPWQIASVLGILRAGAAYVPLAVDMPALRAQAILRDVEAAGLITERDDLDWPLALRPGEEGPMREPPRPAGLSHKSLAYILYTSGTTGRPKGVALRHDAVWNTVAAVNETLGLTPEDRVLGVSSLGFDLSVYDIFGPLSVGGALVLCGEAEARDPAHWLGLVRGAGVTVWNSVPALLDLLLDRVTASAAPLPLRAALLSGDWIPLGQPARLRAAAPGSRFLALGGATEAAIWSNLLEVDEVPPHWRSIPYGYPLPNQSYRVLDGEGHDRPDWVPGDLHIGGVGLAECYWNDPARTAQAFPTAWDDGRRLYRTGDLARYWPDGMLEFLGREDTQVKIGGHRIELGEVEAVLSGLPSVKEAVAVVVDRESGGRQIGAAVLEMPVEPEAVDGAVAAAIRSAAEAAESAAQGEALERLRAFRAASDGVGRIAMHRTLAEIASGRLQPDPAFAGLLRQWPRMAPEPGDLDAACAAFEALPAWPGAELLRGWIVSCCRRAGALASGEQAPLELLFPGATLQHADSLYRHNPAAERLGALSAAMLGAALDARHPEAPLTVLEVGGGVGSFTGPLLPVLRRRGVRYHFTDVSLFFLDAARDSFGGEGDFTTGRFDINLDPADQGLPSDGYDLIVASNVLHDARDLPRTLTYLRRLLVPGGRLLLLEATENTAVQMVTAGFLEGFSAFADFRQEKGLPLLAAPQWREVLREAGFSLAHMGGDALGIGQHVFLAECRGGANPAALRDEAAKRLPDYMVPAAIRIVDTLPLGANGKVDRAALAAELARAAPAGATGEGRPLATPVEQRLADLWSELLATPILSAEADFFRSGGDSLLAIRLIGRIRDAFGVELPVRSLFEAPVLADLAARLEGGDRPALQADTRPLLVLFPGSDGAAGAFASLEAALGDVCRVQAIDFASRAAAPSTGDPLAAVLAQARSVLDGQAPGQRLLLGGWSSGTVLAAALAAQLEDEGRPCDGLVLLDPVDWSRHDVFTDRAEAMAGQAPAWLRDVVAGQLSALAAFAPRPLRVPALCFWAARREAGWPLPEPAWRDLLTGPRHEETIAADHWSLLREAEALTDVARAIRSFVELPDGPCSSQTLLVDAVR